MIFEIWPCAHYLPAGSTSEPGQAVPQLQKALQRNGILDAPAGQERTDPPPETVDARIESDDLKTLPNKSNQNISGSTRSDNDILNPSLSIPKGTQENMSRPKKSVSFAEGTKVENTNPNNTKKHVNETKRNIPNGGKSVQEETSKIGKQNITLYDEEEDEPFDPVIPKDESPEDAALRREMIQYNLGEVGSVVAELDLDESDTTFSDDEIGEDDYDNSSIEDEEDQFGRTKRRVLTDDYLAEMQELQSRLTNVGPLNGQGLLPGADKKESSQKKSGSLTAKDTSNTPAKKGVRFASEVDIQEAPIKSPAKPPPAAADAPTTPNAHKKPIHTSTVIERPFVDVASSDATEPEEYDPALIRSEVAVDYHRRRNHMIQRQGGFMAPEDYDPGPEVPLTEAEGGPKKMSRFKAARLGKLG